MQHLLIILLSCMLPSSSAKDRLCSEFAAFDYFCVPYYQCSKQNLINTNGVGLFDPRNSDKPDCSAAPNHEVAVTSRCSKLLEVCCKHPDDPCKTKRISRPVNPRPDPVPTPALCGKRLTEASNGLGSLPQAAANGEANFGEYPFVCLILKKESFQGQILKTYKCGASLLSDSVVLTTGHCVEDTQNLIVRCGEWDSQSEEEDMPYQEREVQVIKKHPCLDVSSHHNNFALLFLKSPFLLKPHISPVCLPKPGAVFQAQNCVSSGWGKDKFGTEGRYANVLKEIVLPLVEHSKCEKLLRDNTRLGRFYELHDSFICAGGLQGIDTCKGDGGSPLTCRQAGGPWVQTGIVSWGIGCEENNIPAVYANVAAASCWIDQMAACYYKKNGSFFGFSSNDCPDPTPCSQVEGECVNARGRETTDLDVEIFS